ncbi:MAG: hypothetical protein KBC21_04350 [Candidatus Pacebacteria bacterium]|jgi:hypothetical protein|nr:hypothetical protein [Candidatus Paceibacterota bacterium]
MDTLTEEDIRFLKKLSTPALIQDYLESIPFNHEDNGETCMSPRRVIKEAKAHCLEGAMLACAAFILQGRRPLIMSIKVTADDYDHVVALYKENGYWGSVSKTNHAVLGFRDPVYQSTRELAMSYFHEYFLIKNGKKTMRGYSPIISMNRFGKKWPGEERELYDIAIWISNYKHTPVTKNTNSPMLRKATALERETADISRDGRE